jgi:hypothetical protein
MRAWLFTAFLLLPTACSMSSDNASLGSPNNSGGSGGSSSAGGTNQEPVPSSLEFDPLDELVARQQVTVRVHALPARVYRVRFALPSSDGSEPLDAVLDTLERDTDADGTASLQLTAPSGQTTFTVRASVGPKMAALGLQVKDTGYADLQVEPRYLTALRFPTTWIATAHPNKTCDELPGIPPPDGSIISSPAGQNEASSLMRLPANTPLAITLRSGHFVGGCASVSGLLPDSNERVMVPVLNRPIDLAASRLSLKLDLAPGDATWSKLLDAANVAITSTLRGASVDDVDVVLDAMREAAGDDRQSFENARKGENWDALLAAHWGPGAPNQLASLVAGWLTQAQKSFPAGSHLLDGAIEPDSGGESSAQLTLLTISGIAASKSGFVSPAALSWSAGPDDNVAMGTDLYLVESKLLSALGEAVALERVPDVDDAPGALAQKLDCAGSSVVLTQAGSSATLAYGSCDSACLEALCRKGLRAVWLRGAAATALAPSRLTLTATGHAFVGEAAEVAGMTGAWLGQLQHASDPEQPTGGPLTATTPP